MLEAAVATVAPRGIARMVPGSRTCWVKCLNLGHGVGVSEEERREPRVWVILWRK